MLDIIGAQKEHIIERMIYEHISYARSVYPRVTPTGLITTNVVVSVRHTWIKLTVYRQKDTVQRYSNELQDGDLHWTNPLVKPTIISLILWLDKARWY